MTNGAIVFSRKLSLESLQQPAPSLRLGRPEAEVLRPQDLRPRG